MNNRFALFDNKEHTNVNKTMDTVINDKTTEFLNTFVNQATNNISSNNSMNVKIENVVIDGDLIVRNTSSITATAIATMDSSVSQDLARELKTMITEDIVNKIDNSEQGLRSVFRFLSSKVKTTTINEIEKRVENITKDTIDNTIENMVKQDIDNNNELYFVVSNVIIKGGFKVSNESIIESTAKAISSNIVETINKDTTITDIVKKHQNSTDNSDDGALKNVTDLGNNIVNTTGEMVNNAVDTVGYGFYIMIAIPCLIVFIILAYIISGMFGSSGSKPSGTRKSLNVKRPSGSKNKPVPSIPPKALSFRRRKRSLKYKK